MRWYEDPAFMFHVSILGLGAVIFFAFVCGVYFTFFEGSNMCRWAGCKPHERWDFCARCEAPLRREP